MPVVAKNSIGDEGIRVPLAGKYLPTKNPASSLVTKPRGESWWAPLADPSLPREQFFDRARARDAEMACNSEWRRTGKLDQIGHL